MSMAARTEVTVHVWAGLAWGEATNQSQSLPACVSVFFYIYIFFVVEFYFIFNPLFSRHNGTAYFRKGVIVSWCSGPTALWVVCDRGCTV